MGMSGADAGHATVKSEEAGRGARTKCGMGKRTDVRADAGRSDTFCLRLVRHTDAVRAAGHGQQRRGGRALTAELVRGGAWQAVGVGLQVRIGVRLHAELGDEQRQRQQVNDQAATTSEQDLGPPAPASIRRLRLRDNGPM